MRPPTAQLFCLGRRALALYPTTDRSPVLVEGAAGPRLGLRGHVRRLATASAAVREVCALPAHFKSRDASCRLSDISTAASADRRAHRVR